jgi:Tfp pilus assembly protein PilP
MHSHFEKLGKNALLPLSPLAVVLTFFVLGMPRVALSQVPAEEVVANEKLEPAGNVPSNFTSDEFSTDNMEAEFDEEQPEEVDAPLEARGDSAKKSKAPNAKHSSKSKKSAPIATKDAPADAADSSKSKDASQESLGEEEKWESYSDMPAIFSVAEEITGGVRIEDIVEPPSDYHYASFGRSDPFVPPMPHFEAIEGERLVDNLEIPIVSPLQRYAISSLNVVGIWQTAAGERKAMILTPEGRSQGIVVKVGDPIGDRGGKIMDIGTEDITVREFSLAPDGTRQFEDRKMLIGRTKPEAQKEKLVFKPGAGGALILKEDASSKLSNGIDRTQLIGLGTEFDTMVDPQARRKAQERQKQIADDEASSLLQAASAQQLQKDASSLNPVSTENPKNPQVGDLLKQSAPSIPNTNAVGGGVVPNVPAATMPKAPIGQSF